MSQVSIFIFKNMKKSLTIPVYGYIILNQILNIVLNK